jgi:hypothetical protein
MAFLSILVLILSLYIASASSFTTASVAAIAKKSVKK